MALRPEREPAVKNHILIDRVISMAWSGQPVDEFIEFLRTTAADLGDPRIFPGTYESDEPYIRGWRPMTDDEIATAEKRRAAAKRAAEKRAATRRAKELAELRRLAKKLDIRVADDE